MIDEKATADFLEKIRIEYKRSRQQFSPFHSGHEGYAVVLEELDEVWECVKNKEKTLEDLHSELVQVAAMACAMFVEIR
jgi:hypothetical protein